MREYATFLESKRKVHADIGDVELTHPRGLYPFQRDIVSWALRKGRSAIFADCGLGKTPMQLCWAHHVPGDVLIVAPLAVAHQTIAEGERFGWPATYVTERPEGKVSVTNYEHLHKFDSGDFSGIVLDESSILKNVDGKFRKYVTETWTTRYRLACTATPAPNDHMELGTHAEFVGAMTRAEMLATYFTHDGGDTSKWRLKGHAADAFWDWVASWSMFVRKPSDLGYSDEGFELPSLAVKNIVVDAPVDLDKGSLVNVASTMRERITARKESAQTRVEAVASMINRSNEPWIIWCNLNSESVGCVKAIADAVEVSGSMPMETKRQRLVDFTEGRIRVLVTKPKIAGLGMNWQHCARMAFVGLSDSWESYYQALRRCWRFMQQRDVEAWIVISSAEGAVMDNIRRKEREALTMGNELAGRMGRDRERPETVVGGHAEIGSGWTMRLGDCVQVVGDMDRESVGYSIFSPPFASLYTYTDMPEDMGNTASDAEFVEHFSHLIPELRRVTKPGRLVSFHCMQLPLLKARDGVIGLRDFRGELIRAFEADGWIYHSEVCIWKDPVTAMQRTKALGLLHKQVKKDAAMSRQGIADYLVTMRKPGDNPEPVTNTNDTFPVQVWQRYASPVWSDINPSDTLQRTSAREHKDERHIAPLQLEVIRRAIRLWSNPGDLVLSPFAGIGSEGHEALRMQRRFAGVELKRSYFNQATANLANAASHPLDMWSL